MKKTSIIIVIIAFAFACNAQVNQTPPYQKTDTGRVDSSQVEKINKMPMDSSHNNTLSPSVIDTTMQRRMGDDEDPKRNNPKKKE